MPSTTQSTSAPGRLLVVTQPDGTLQRFPLTPGQPSVIGRGAGCDIRFEHEQVSRRHAEVSCDAQGRWMIRDLGSRNGILRGGSRLEGPTEIVPGSAVVVGPYAVALAPPAGSTAAPVADAPEDFHTIAAVDDRKTSTVQPLTHTPRSFNPAILSKLHQLDQWLMDLPDPAQRYHRLCEFVIQENPGAQYCAVLDPGGDAAASNDVRVLQSIQRNKAREPYLSRTLLDQVASTREPTLLSNTPDQGDGMMLSIAPEQALVSAIACPLEDGAGGPIFYATFHTREVDPSWLDLMVLIADQYQHASAMLRVIENAHERAALDRDLARGREIQNGLLPKPWDGGGIDIAYGFRPCLTVGGDYLDAVSMPDGRVLVAIADVTGKGLQAALIASSIHTMVHAVVQTGGEPTDVMAQLNNYLIHFAPAGSFATMVLLAINPGDGAAQVINAGHCPIVTIDANGNASTLQHEHGYLPLGIDTQDYHNETTTLAPGTSWFLYTDGLSELAVPVEDGGPSKLLGIEGVTDLTAKLYRPNAQQTVDAWMQHLAVENEGQGQGDDQTMICIRRPI